MDGCLRDARFVVPAGSVSLIIGALLTFFGTAPAILMDGLGLSSLGLGLFFAATVFVVFGAGFLAPRLAHRWGQRTAATAGLAIALGGSVALLAGAPGLVHFSVALTTFLLGMGLVNPLATALALHPFGREAGSASALLGFLQLACAALAISIAGALDLTAYTALGAVLTGSTALALIIFLTQVRKA